MTDELQDLEGSSFDLTEYYLCIFIEGVGKATRNLSQDNQSPG